MSSGSSYDSGVPRPRRRRIIRAPITPPAVERIPARARAGIGGQTDLRYCPCGGKRRDGKCVRGCDA